MRSANQRAWTFFGPTIAIGLMVGVIAFVKGSPVVGAVLVVLALICAAGLAVRVSGRGGE